LGYLVFSREKAGQVEVAEERQPESDPRISQVDWSKELQEALALADKQDPGWRLAQLEEKRATVPDAENSALVILEARKLLPHGWPAWLEKDETLISDEILWNLEPPVQLDAGLTKALLEELRKAEKALITLRKVRTRPQGRCPIENEEELRRIPMPIGHPYFPRLVQLRYTLIPNHRELADLLVYDILVRVQEKDLNGALDSCHALLKCGRAIGDEPSLFLMIIRDDLHGLVTSKLERILAQGEAGEVSLSSIQQELENEAKVPLFLIAARGQRAETEEEIQGPHAEVGWAVHPFESPPLPRRYSALNTRAQRRAFANEVLMTRCILLRNNNEMVNLAKLRVEQQAARVRKWKEGIRPDLSTLDRWCADHFCKVATRFLSDQANLRCAIAMVAVERYRRANNRWPDRLSHLVPGYLSNVPLDPFDGKPLRYRCVDDGVVIYSLGSDGEDNGGKFDKDPMKEGFGAPPLGCYEAPPSAAANRATV
jgi:hypothetical protein